MTGFGPVLYKKSGGWMGIKAILRITYRNKKRVK